MAPIHPGARPSTFLRHPALHDGCTAGNGAADPAPQLDHGHHREVNASPDDKSLRPTSVPPVDRRVEIHVISIALRVAEPIPRGSAYPRRMVDPEDRGPVFDGFRIGRPATGALLDAGYRAIADLPSDLDDLLALHGVGPKAVRLLWQARAD